MTQVADREEVTSFTQDLAEMVRIVADAIPAGSCAVRGVVGGRFEAVYGFLTNPPRVAQVSLTGREGLTAIVTVVGVIGEDEPTAAQGRFTYGSYATGTDGTAQEIFEAAMNEELAPRADVTNPDMIANAFDSVYANLEEFQPIV